MKQCQRAASGMHPTRSQFSLLLSLKLLLPQLPALLLCVWDLLGIPLRTCKQLFCLQWQPSPLPSGRRQSLLLPMWLPWLCHITIHGSSRNFRDRWPAALWNCGRTCRSIGPVIDGAWPLAAAANAAVASSALLCRSCKGADSGTQRIARRCTAGPLPAGCPHELPFINEPPSKTRHIRVSMELQHLWERAKGYHLPLFNSHIALRCTRGPTYV